MDEDEDKTEREEGTEPGSHEEAGGGRETAGLQLDRMVCFNFLYYTFSVVAFNFSW